MSTEPKPQRAPREPRDRRPPQPQQSHSQSQQQAHGPRRHPRQQGGRRQPHVAAPAASRTATTEPTDAAAAASASAAGAAATALPPLPDLPDLPDVGKLEVSRSTAEEQSEPELAEPEHSCPVCADRIYILAAGACNHGVCHRCALRLRVLCGDNHCPVCRAELAKILITDDRSAVVEAGHLIGGRTGWVYEQRWSAWCSSTHVRARCQELFQLKCRLCGIHCPRPADLKTHVKRQHDRSYCEFCWRDSTRFYSEQPLYTNAELQVHTKSGDGMAFRGHPACEYCKTRFYDSDELFKHMSTTHEKCQLCEQRGERDVFLLNAANLAKHYQEAHFPCPHGCHLVAFANQLDLQDHILTQHPSAIGSGKAARLVDPATLFSDAPAAGAGAAGPTPAESGRGRGRQGRGGRGGGRSEGRSARPAESAAAAAPAATAPAVPSAAPVPVTDASAFPTLGSVRGAAGAPAAPAPSRFTEAIKRTAAAPPGAVVFPRGAPIADMDSWPTLGGTTRPSTSTARPAQATARAAPAYPNGAPATAGASGAPAAAAPPAAGSRPPAQGFVTAPLRYAKPSNFKQRNTALIQRLRQSMSEAQFMEFQSMTAHFRDGRIDAKKYFDHCWSVIPPNVFDSIYAELVALLPDIDLQKRLVEAYNNFKSRGGVMTVSHSGKQTRVLVKPSAQKKTSITWTRCQHCGQVVQPADREEHSGTHAVDDGIQEFPTLSATRNAAGRSSTAAPGGTWVR